MGKHKPKCRIFARYDDALFLRFATEMIMHGHIILSHGSGSSPDATKVSALAEQAQTWGWNTQRPDFREDDVLGFASSVKPRLHRLRRAIDASPVPPVLVGSSMGAFVSGLVSLDVPVAALFLLATPAVISGYPQPFDLCADVSAWFIHGWRDEVCPYAAVQALAASHRLPLLMLDDDHRMGSSLDVMIAQFRFFLEHLVGAT